LANITTPLLLVHGGADETAPPAQSEEMFTGLRRLNRDVEYAKYAGEGHQESSWSGANLEDIVAVSALRALKSKSASAAVNECATYAGRLQRGE
jgi:pimeloyl-ACP methyl ester carboxylesterase